MRGTVIVVPGKDIVKKNAFFLSLGLDKHNQRATLLLMKNRIRQFLIVNNRTNFNKDLTVVQLTEGVNMKKVVLWISALVCIVLSTACTNINSSDAGSLTIYPETVGPVDYYRPLYTINTKQRVSGDATASILFGLFIWSDSDSAAGIADNADIYGSGLGFLWSIFPNAKRLAAQSAFFDACKKAKCDAIIAGRYEVTTKDYFIFKKCKVQVTGYPATLSGVETVKPVPYYINDQGKIVFLDKFIRPYRIEFSGASPSSGTSWLF